VRWGAKEVLYVALGGEDYELMGLHVFSRRYGLRPNSSITWIEKNNILSM